MSRTKGSYNRNESAYRKLERLVNEGTSWEEAKNLLKAEGSKPSTLRMYEYKIKKESGHLSNN